MQVFGFTIANPNPIALNPVGSLQPRSLARLPSNVCNMGRGATRPNSIVFEL